MASTPLICSCGKDGWKSKSDAGIAGRSFARKHGRKFEVYRCKENPEHYHFATSKGKRRKKTGRPHGV